MNPDTSRRGLSIGTRLTVLNIVVVLIVMVVFAVVVTWQLSSTFQAEHRRFFQDKAAELQADLVDGHGRAVAVLAEIDRETAKRDVRQYQARVMTAGDRVLGATPGMQAVLPSSVFPKGTGLDAGVRQHVSGRHVFALATVPLQTSNGTPALRVQIAMDITRDHRLLSALRHAIWMTFGLLTVLLVLAGYAVSLHSLAPLKRIVNAARAVTPAHLAGRIPTDPPWPRELAELVEVFNAMLTRLEEAFARLSRFSADLAHELRTPVSNMSSATEVCLLRERDGQDYRAVLESNLEECRRLATLIDNLLFMARAEHAEAAAHVETFDGAEACTWIAAQQAPAAAARGVMVEISGDASVTADPVLFRQAVTNLVANAIVHAGTAGTVGIELGADRTGSTVRVVDHGIGIDAMHLPHLFDRFYRVDPARSHNRGQGTGLGLAIVKTIADLHGGSVDIQSERGVGTRVTLRFPSLGQAVSRDPSQRAAQAS